MNGQKILLGIVEDKEAFLMVQLAYRLREIGYDAYIFRTEISDNYIPLAYMEDLLTYKINGWDLIVIGPGNEDIFRYNSDIGLKNLVESTDIEVIFVEELDNLELIIEKIQVKTKGYVMQEYSFLFTLGYFNEHLTNNHFIGTYRNDKLIYGLIKTLVLSGANVSIIASDNIGRVSYAEDVIYVKNQNELEIVLNSKFFKYDFVINAINIPRFGLTKGERFKIEYQRYFAEFDEKFLPFVDVGLSSNNQLIIEVINGSIDNEDAIKYLFENSCVNLVMLSEIDKSNNDFKPFVKLINRDGSADIIAFKDNKIMYKELINELKAKIEG
ncbi:MAG: hypothetical protein FD141_1059 [Fusobacteria bacterium]|nr:MAG: hypothetical protein FD141_1059 [Fusobacteriota bacterium]KAF0229772.1 MAG: hypothetical protein FD182_162 [Fusobacteriota bacterium]